MAEYRRRFGDRADGRRVRNLTPYDMVSPYIMVTRTDAQNLLMDKFETSAADRYIRTKRRGGLERFGMQHVLLASYIRMVSQKPAVNRFISGQKIFSREKIEVNMVVKEALREDVSDTVIKILFEPEDTAAKVYERFEDALGKAFADKENEFDAAARIINYIPGLVKKFTVWLLKLLDYFGLLPGFLLKVSPFHGSMFITSMGSLGIPPVFHHLYSFGNIPVFMAFGAKRYENELSKAGNVVRRKYIDYTFVTDERICDGFYFASGLKLLRSYLADPFVLDKTPETVVRDIR
ncbi:MAG: hypothetical protein GX028_10970 [Clostridiaceae bacterium]|nr:hypothetical protein [Clostridiaceae bacterium]